MPSVECINDERAVVPVELLDTEPCELPLEYFRLDILCDPLIPVSGSMSLQKPSQQD